MPAFSRLAQLVHGAPRDDLATVAQERLDDVLEVEQPRLTILERHHVDAEHRFHRRLLVEIVEHHVGDFAALQLDDNAHAVLVGLVAQLRDAIDQLAAHQLGDPLQQARLVDLIRQFGDDDRLVATIVEILDMRAGADEDSAAARRIRVVDLPRAIDDACRRKIRSRNQHHQLRNPDRRIVDQRDAGVDDFRQVVRRNVGRHADRDSRGAVDQQVRHARR